MALFEIAVTDGSTGGHYGLVSFMELAAHRGDHPIGLPPNGSTESLPARPKINSVRAKVLPAAKRLYAHPRAALKGRITLELSSARHPAHPDMPLQALRLLCGLPAGRP